MMENMLKTLPESGYTEGDLSALVIDENEHLKNLSAPAFAFYSQLLISSIYEGEIVGAPGSVPFPFEYPETVAELEAAGLLQTCTAVDDPHKVTGYFLPRGGDIQLPLTRAEYPAMIAAHLEYLDQQVSAENASATPGGAWAVLSDPARLLYARIVARASGSWLDYWAGDTPEIDGDSPALAELFKAGAVVVDDELYPEQVAGDEPVRYWLPWWAQFVKSQQTSPVEVG